nr:unnamed protein product [Digitaria exilis]
MLGSPASAAFSIAYIHAICVVLEIIVSCMFYRSCKRSEADELTELELEEKGDLQASALSFLSPSASV